MPYLKIQTNMTISPTTELAILRQFSETVAAELGKQERYVMIALEAGRPMIFSGESSPTAYLELKSLGLTEENTVALSRALCGAVNRELSIPTDRVYIEFSSPPRPMWGWNNKTF